MDQEDRQIRGWLLMGSVAAISGLIGTALLVTVFIATNFNPLNWLE